MIEIDDRIISEDILLESFCCDVTKCRGECCVEGNSGAPLDLDEVDILEQEWENYKPYMTEQGVEVIERDGFMVVDQEGDYTTPLINDSQCAYSFEENGITFCAVERAFREGKTGFKKPISCHLYPIRLINFSNGSVGLNYHRWSVCSSAVECGKKLNMPVYMALKEPLVRRFGEEFFDALQQAQKYIKSNGKNL